MPDHLRSSHFHHTALRDWTAQVLARCGVAPAPAALTARVLLRTSLRGVDTHGISRLPVYVDKLASGEVNAHAAPHIEQRHGLLHCDGDGGLGQVVASLALDHALAVARESAVVACSILASGHLAALGTLLLPATEQGMFALLCQRTPPVMALPDALSPAIGNNPLAFALPLAGQPPLVFDMAHSVVARGHLMQAVREGRDTIPADWAIGPDGQPTTDPARALQGAMLPIAGYKGMGLAMLVECLAGSLSGAAPPQDAVRSGTQGSAGNVSAFLLVINPVLAVGQAAFDTHVAAWLQTYHQASGAAARYPGQRQAACEQQRLSHGIPVPPGLLAELRALGQRVGQPFDLQLL